MGVVVYGTGYVKTPLGLLKLTELLSCLLAIILVAISTHGYSWDYISAFYAGTVSGTIISFLIILLSVSISLSTSTDTLLKFQCYIHGILFLFILIVSAVVLSRWWNNTMIAGGSFGIIASIIYLIDAYMSYTAYGNTIICN